jgi:hypothetical protein
MLRTLFARPDGKWQPFCEAVMLYVERDVTSRFLPANDSHKCEVCGSDHSVLGHDAVQRDI